MRALLFIFAIACSAQVVRIPGVGGSGGAPPACTPVTGYLHCRVLTMDHTQAGGSDSTNWALVTQNSGGAMTLGSSRIQNASCFDVVFTSDSAGTTLIPWEVETCTQSTGAMIAWVKVATLSHSADTKVYVSYDNSSITTAQNTGALAPANVWDTATKGVYHLPNGSSLTANDSTSNAVNGTVNGATAAAGNIDGAASFNGTSAYIVTSTSAAFNLTGSATIEFWANITTVGTTELNMMVENADDSVNFGIAMETNHGHAAMNTLNTGFNFVALEGTTSLSNSTWYHLVGVYDQTNTIQRIYVNGSQENTATQSGTLNPNASTFYTFGKLGNETGRFFGGLLDEIRIVGAVRSPDWITSDYNNQKSSSTFLTVGSEN